MTISHQELQTLRDAAQNAELTLVQASKRLAMAEIELARLQQLLVTPRIQQLIQAAMNRVAQARAEVAVAQVDATSKRVQLDLALEALSGQLDPAVPVALLPVRLETRFMEKVRGSGKLDLLIRIYPDDIHSYTHETELTEAEGKFGKHFWEEWWRAGKEPDRASQNDHWTHWRRVVSAAWRQLVQRLGTERALWVARRFHPMNPEDIPLTAVPVPTTLPTAPKFPELNNDDPARGAWNRAAEASCLPDRFAAVGFRNKQEVFRVWSDLVRNPLPIGPDPTQLRSPSAESSAEPFDEARFNEWAQQQDWYRWKTDFEVAVAAGMGIRVDSSLIPSDKQIDMLLVFGVRGTGTPDDSAAELARLFEGHLYTWGLGLVPQGTPTNNTPAARSAYRRTDPAPADTLDLVYADLPPSSSDAAVLAKAFGLPMSLLGAVAHTNSIDQADARAINVVAWSAWWAYFCRRLVGDVFDGWEVREATLTRWRQHFLNYVRARGPLPALRVGSQPYGVLPVSSLDQWDVDPMIADLLVMQREQRGIQFSAMARFAWDYSDVGGRGAWGPPAVLPEFGDGSSIHGVAIAKIADLRGFNVLVLEAISAPASDVHLRIGRDLVGTGVVRGGWTSPIALPIRNAPGLSFAIGVSDFGGNSANLAVLQVEGARATLQIGRQLGGDGNVAGGWSNPIDLRLMLPASSRALGMAFGHLANNNRLDAVIVAALAQAPGTNEVVALFIGRDLNSDGVAVGGWTTAINVPGLADGAVAAAVSINSPQPGLPSQLTLHIAGSQFANQRPNPNRLISQVGTITETPMVNISWGTQAVSTIPGGIPTALAAAQMGRQPGVDLSSEAGLINLLAKLRDAWQEQLDSGKVPTFGVSKVSDPDKTFLELLSTDATTTSIAARSLVGPKLVSNLWRFMGTDFDLSKLSQYVTDLMQEAGTILRELGLPQNVWLTQVAYAEETTEISTPLVQAAPLSESDPLDVNYIAWLAFKDVNGYRDPEAVHKRGYLRNPDDVEPILLKLLRHALLNGYIDAALHQPQQAGTSAAHQQDAFLGKGIPNPDGTRTADVSTIDPELVGLKDIVDDRDLPPGIRSGQTRWGYMQAIDNATRQTLGAQLRSPNVDAELDELRASLEHLATRPSAALERLLTESLDLASHRLDAWITSLPTRRLTEMRTRRPNGLHFGAWGFVEHLSPRDSTNEQSAGFVHTPSLGHATAASVLRSAWLAHGGDGQNDNPFAIDLTSARVRCALDLMQGVRQRQPLGALLGYQFERGLHEHYPGLELDKFIAPLRKLFPLVADKLTQSSAGEAAESVAARNVVDGLTLVRAWDAKSFKPDTVTHRPEGDELNKSIDAELTRLRDSLDAVSDLGMAESVYQAVHGRHSRSGASLDALSKGTVMPPEMEFARTPRTGVAFTHRILVVIGARPAETDTAVAHWAADPSVAIRQVRRIAEPALDRWVAALLGDPKRVGWRVHDDGSPAPVMPNRTLHDLGLSALDAIYLSTGPEPEAQSDLEMMLALDAARTQPPEKKKRILLDRHDSWTETTLSLPEFLAVAKSVRDLIAEATPASGTHLAGPGNVNSNVDVAELATRAANANTALQNAAQRLRNLFAIDDIARDVLRRTISAPDSVPDDLTNLLDLPPHLDLPSLSSACGLPSTGLTPLRDALIALWFFGFAGAVPQSSSGDGPDGRNPLVRQAHRINAEAQRRLLAVKVIQESIAQKATPAVEDYLAVFAEIFGRNFRVLPHFTVTDAPSLANAFTNRKAAADAGPADVLAWFERVARVRPGAARLGKAFMMSEAGAGDVQMAFDVAQLPLPAEGTDRWLARTLNGNETVPGGRVSFVVHHPASLDPMVLKNETVLAGLVVDEWVEVIPNRSETTGIALHYDAPASAAPNAILLAVPAILGRPWSVAALESVLLETIRLAKLRTIDPDNMPGKVGHFLPAVYFAFNAGDDTVASSFRTPNG